MKDSNQNHTSGEWNMGKIAAEIDYTARGLAFYGNALRVAKDFKFLNQFDRSTIDCWLKGRQDFIYNASALLQDIALKISIHADKSLSRAYDEGYEARRNDVALSSNPYPAGSNEHNSWESGHYAAHESWVIYHRGF